MLQNTSHIKITTFIPKITNIIVPIIAITPCNASIAELIIETIKITPTTTIMIIITVLINSPYTTSTISP